MKRLSHILLIALMALSPLSTPLVTATVAVAGVALLVGCSQSEVDALKAKILERLKSLSAKFTNLAQRIADAIPGNAGADILARIVDNNTKIQAAQELGPVLKTYLQAAVRGGDDLLKLAEMVPGIGAEVAVVRDILSVLRGFATTGVLDERAAAAVK